MSLSPPPPHPLPPSPPPLARRLTTLGTLWHHLLASLRAVALCDGKDSKLRYKGAPFHRVVKDAWIQGGDIVSGRGDGGASIFGETFADESFAIKFDSPGILAMANTVSRWAGGWEGRWEE